MSFSDIRYCRLGYVAINVSDVEASRSFYRDIVGLRDDGAGGEGRAYLRCSDRHHDVALFAHEGPPGLKRIAWQMESDVALAAVRAHFDEIGIAVHDVPAEEAADLGISPAFRITEPTTGTTFEFYVDMAVTEPYQPTHTTIAQLGHAVLNTTDRAATEAFLTDHMNFRVSDRIDGFVSFMRCFPNPYHHSLGVGSGSRPALNHVNFMVTNIDDIGKGMYRCQKNDVPIVFGPGKHPPSESVFLYFLDPDKLTLEYSYGMEEFPEVEPREARMMPGTMESVDYWGAPPADPAFAKTGEIERLPASVSA